MKSFENKIVIITGGTAGIGRATAVAFAEEGASVVVSGRREAEGAESVALIDKAGGKGFFVRTDVAKEADVANLVAQTVARFGRLDFAFNNAGIYPDAGRSVLDATEEVFSQTFDINVRGLLFGLKYQIPAIIKSGGGAIVNNASVLGLRPMPGSAIYNASKSAVIGLTKTAALEFAKQGVRINAVCPAVINTDMTALFRGNAEIEARVKSFHPMGRFGEPREVAAAVLYLCSPGASFTTGIALPVDAGFSV